MSTEDISRHVFQPRKRYSGVRMQQGRVLLDSDWNEDERIESEEARRTLIDIVCAKGSSNQGFRVLSSGSPITTYDFSYENGSFYLGGLRFETETDAGTPERFLNQPDWLQIETSNLLQLPTLTGTEVRYDLVYLHGWEQVVTAVEDSELRDRALGGPDSSVRIRRMRRVEVLTDVSGTCAESFSDLQQALSAPITPDTGGSHQFDQSSCELVSKARLTVSFDPNGSTEDPCKPTVTSGYLGADNQAIRVQLMATNRFIWGYDNAAPLYRVQVKDTGVAGGERRKIKFLTLPRDQMAHPLAGQAVEIIPWGAILPNKEKVAEFQGQLFTIATSYDPEDQSITLSQPVLQDWLDWLSYHSEYWSDRDPSDQQQYLYLRLWTGGSGDASLADHSFTPGTSVSLPGTGLQVTFSDYGLPGDFWVIAARPNTPDIVVPWELLDQASPSGPRFFFAPLALIRWSLNTSNQLQASIQDCRETFQPLCQIRGCCTVTVGEGTHGDFNSIQDALNSLPEDGGRICILPGTYTENVRIENKRNITITGCGDRSRIISKTPAASSIADPVFHLQGSQNVQIDSLAIEADDAGIGILIEKLLVSTTGGDIQTGTEVQSREILLTDLHIQAATRSGIEVRNGQLIAIRNCHICMDDVAGSWPGIYFVAEDGLIESNVIRVQLDTETVPTTSDLLAAPPPAALEGRGGLQIGSTSEYVGIIDNLIHTGIGNGITLGSVVIRDSQTDLDSGTPIGWIVDYDDPCSPCKPGNTYVPTGQTYQRDANTPSQTVSAGDHLTGIYIENNRIFNMGLNGIGVVGFFNLDEVDEFISVEQLSIINNEIRQCLWRDLEEIPSGMVNSMGYGGISLADVENLVIFRNQIEDNGPNYIEPICGIFVLHGEGIDISENRILNNGAKTSQPDSEAKRGQRGGINVVFGIAPTTDITQNIPRQNGIPAIKIHNNIVSTPLGQALSITALGPVSVIGNQFTSRGVVSQFLPASPSFIAATVAILNLGLSNEFYGQLLGFTLMRWGQQGVSKSNSTSAADGTVVIPRQGLDDLLPGQVLANGNVLFSNNQCVLDLLELEVDLALTSILIASLDAIDFHKNQCDSSLFLDFLLSQVVLLGVSVHATDNRLKEGLLNALYSAVTLGIINTTTDNQVTHCLLIRGWEIFNKQGSMLWSGKVDDSNIIFYEGIHIFFRGVDPDDQGKTPCNILGLAQLMSDFGNSQKG